MKAVVFHGIGDIRLDDVKETKLKKPNDAILALTASTIGGLTLIDPRPSLRNGERDHTRARRRRHRRDYRQECSKPCAWRSSVYSGQLQAAELAPTAEPNTMRVTSPIQTGPERARRPSGIPRAVGR
jgi:hypothetical protein